VEDASEDEDNDNFVEDDIGDEEVGGLLDDQEKEPAGIPSVAEKFASISLSKKKKAAEMSATSASFKMDFVCPHMLLVHDCVDDDGHHCTIDFLVPTMAKSSF